MGLEIGWSHEPENSAHALRGWSHDPENQLVPSGRKTAARGGPFSLNAGTRCRQADTSSSKRRVGALRIRRRGRSGPRGSVRESRSTLATLRATWQRAAIVKRQPSVGRYATGIPPVHRNISAASKRWHPRTARGTPIHRSHGQPGRGPGSRGIPRSERPRHRSSHGVGSVAALARVLVDTHLDR